MFDTLFPSLLNLLLIIISYFIICTHFLLGACFPSTNMRLCQPLLTFVLTADTFALDIPNKINTHWYYTTYSMNVYQNVHWTKLSSKSSYLCDINFGGINLNITISTM